MLDITVEGGAVLLPVKVVPGASRTRYLGEWRERARIAVASPPEKGKANQTLIAYLAGLFGVRKRDVSVIRGLTSPEKTIRIERVSIEVINAALQPGRS